MKLVAQQVDIDTDLCGTRGLDIIYSCEPISILVSWGSQTAIGNVVWLRLVYLKLGWPLIQFFSGFFSLRDEAGEGFELEVLKGGEDER